MAFDPLNSIKKFFADARHILSISNKPSNEEFKRTLKVVLFGTLVLGIFGYIISLIVGLIV
jgi:protein translocase SEC61 complex gamma subunit